MNLKSSIKILCVKKGKKQKELAEHLGITEIYLCRRMNDNNWLQGEAKEESLNKMAEFFDVSQSDFIEAGL